MKPLSAVICEDLENKVTETPQNVDNAKDRHLIVELSCRLSHKLKLTAAFPHCSLWSGGSGGIRGKGLELSPEVRCDGDRPETPLDGNQGFAITVQTGLVTMSFENL
ncbi:hypothetical protein DY000_02035771 [Brassica cretica]|uniref:Uncharacterized protein n=1 Tax=Brassica cretica TaxID=69181 RepID=A0ABQ7DL91_BRACR|nr:hypothetical protein DY000_02035771 [Brassica cretica]